MMQASGMQHEDCIEDYALRVSGSMTTVFCEDVRNYHWEFYREIYGDTPTDKVSHGLIKNPWYFPLALQIEDRRWEIDRWYRLDFLEEGPRQRSAVNGFTVIDVTDSPHNNNGPIFTSGRVMLRFMMHTDITGRNFCTLNRPLFTNYKV